MSEPAPQSARRPGLALQVPSASSGAVTSPTRINVRNVNAFYGAKQALFDVNLEIPDNAVTAFIGASGCGKSTLLRCLNRMNDTIPGARVDGEILMDGADINAADIYPVSVRTRIGLVFQNPSPFPMSIYDNVAYGPPTHKRNTPKAELDHLDERFPRRANHYTELTPLAAIAELR